MKTYGIVDENGLIAKNYNGLEIPATLTSSKTLTDNGEVYRKIERALENCGNVVLNIGSNDRLYNGSVDLKSSKIAFTDGTTTVSYELSSGNTKIVKS